MERAYATVSELETQLSKHATDNPNDYTPYSLSDAAQHLGKDMLPLKKIDRAIAAYIREHSQEASGFKLQTVPRYIRGLVELVLQPENVDGWLQDPEAYEGNSPTDLLSALDQEKMYANTRKIYDTFNDMTAFATVLDFPTFDDVLYITRLTQYEQLDLK